MASKKQVINKWLVLYYKESQSFKIGISIPKKFANAVSRNKIKRQTKAILRTLNLFNLKLRIVLIIRKEYIDAAFEEKVKFLKNIFNKLGGALANK
ncbi:ribonuclease P protein component [Mycoplasma phocimorsus]|nr:ribonuclease P protein component [Mycoplasma phocimorsus]MDJ1647070.1 ribonuclease P protein component [Mycoplasma phocimorsus]MDJ1649155.1 ribonuclease P protein component [Mycoplasma phocimorsus]